MKHGTELLKRGFAKMQKGGVVMDVTDAKQAQIAENAGAVAVMALERVPADIRAEGGVARMADPVKIQEILDTVTIPVMAKVRIGHFVEAQILQDMGVDMIDESEVLTPADPYFHVDKSQFSIPFVCGCRNLGEAVRRIAEGAAMMRTKGEAGTGNIVEAVRHQRMVTTTTAALQQMTDDQLHAVAHRYSASFAKLRDFIAKEQFGREDTFMASRVFSEKTLEEWTAEVYKVVIEIKNLQRFPVVNFAAGGIATPADAALMMQLGSDGVFVGSGIFKSQNPAPLAKATVEAVLNFDKPDILKDISKGLGEPMKGIEISDIPEDQRLQERGW
jgi:pyridoxal 5'-phosphate synthase pdxS subunit